MKFLCVPCDAAMQLEETRPPDRGSISLVYGCPKCGYEFAMLTNPMETQVVGSLGIQVGSDAGQPAAARESKCPFTGVVRELTVPGAETVSDGIAWTAEAQQRLASLPDFVRPAAKSGIESYARDKGYPRIDDAVLDEARRFFGM